MKEHLPMIWFVLVLLVVVWWLLPVVVSLRVQLAGDPLIFALEREGPWIRARHENLQWGSVRVLNRDDLDNEIRRRLNFESNEDYLAGDEAFAYYLAKWNLRVVKAPPRWLVRLWPPFMRDTLVRIEFPYEFVVKHGHYDLLEPGDE